MKRHLVLLMEKFFPNALLIYRSINNRAIFKKKYKSLQNHTRSKLFNISEIKVLSGPFKGLKYIDEVVWGSITPKWLGSYEAELHIIIETIIAQNYDVIIDVGCAEGYYAAGLAFKLPTTTVFAFDTDFISRKQLARLAKLNNILDRVKIGKFCTFKDISNLYRNKTVLISDIEGYERILLNPDECIELKKIDILVEIHDWQAHTDTDQLLFTRFKKTHDITEIFSASREKWISSFKSTVSYQKIDDLLLKNSTDESRSNGLKWFWMKARIFSI